MSRRKIMKRMYARRKNKNGKDDPWKLWWNKVFCLMYRITINQWNAAYYIGKRNRHSSEPQAFSLAEILFTVYL